MLKKTLCIVFCIVTMMLSAATTYTQTFPGDESNTSQGNTFRSRTEIMPGFPVNVGYSFVKPPTVFDITGDGHPEIFQSHGNYMWAFDYQGNIIDNWPFGESEYNDSSGPAVGDINSDGVPEVVVQLFGENLWVLTPEAVALPGFPFTYNSNSMSSSGNTAVLAQMNDNEEDVEIIVPFGKRYIEETATFNEAGIFALDNQGNLLDGFPHIFYDESQCFNICVGDIDGDEENEIAAAVLNGTGASASGNLFVFERDGSIKDGFPIEAGSWVIWCSLVDVDNDGTPEIFYSSLDGNLYAVDADGSSLPGFPVNCNQMLWGQPIPGDIDGDGDIEIIVAGSNRFYAFHHDGSSVDGWPISGADYANQFPLIVDVDNDGDGEIFLAFAENIYCYDGNGELMSGDYPISLDDKVTSSMLVTDADMDGDMELLACSRYPANNMYLFDLDYAYSEEAVQWGMFNQNPQHTGVLIHESINDFHENTTPVGVESFNYPNPFNPTTTIHYSLSEPSNLELTVYNVNGQKITTLKNEFHISGDYSVEWSGKDFSGIPVSSGIFLYEIKTENTSSFGKMLLMK